MKNKILIPTILFVVVLIFSFAIVLKNKSPEKNIKTKEQNQIILFYGNSCPHCKIVENYIQQNQIESKISFVQKEVYYNQNNAAELKEKAKKCGISTDSIGVPFLWDGKKCFIGDKDIINFFKQKN